MARTESSGFRLDANSAPSKQRRLDAVTRRRSRRRAAVPSRGKSLAALERTVTSATHAVLTALLAAVNDFTPDAPRLNRSGNAMATHERGGSYPKHGSVSVPLGVGGSDVTDDEYEAPLESVGKEPLRRLIETERSRMILIDTLLGALDALFAEQHENRRKASQLTAADPSLILVLLRRMLGRIINRLDPVYVDPLVEAVAQPRQRRSAPKRGPLPTQGSGTPRRRKRDQVSGREDSSVGVGDFAKARGSASRRTRSRKVVPH